jgi:hypothetical protein
MLLYFHLIWLCFIFSIIRHVIIICGVSGWKSYFVVFHIYKVGVVFTSPSEPMCHPFGNDAPHIKLWGALFWNYPAYFGQHENDDQHVLSGYIRRREQIFRNAFTFTGFGSEDIRFVERCRFDSLSLSRMSCEPNAHFFINIMFFFTPQILNSS